jgi:choice-of-anchor B domain-containing protein
MYVKDGYVYQTNYTTGLRILRIGNLASDVPSDWLTEVAYFDTYPWGDFEGYDGAWNNYPFFPSGNIAVSDIDGGLFILRASLPEPGHVMAWLVPLSLIVARTRRVFS